MGHRVGENDKIFDMFPEEHTRACCLMMILLQEFSLSKNARRQQRQRRQQTRVCCNRIISLRCRKTLEDL